jgi:uncharacterized coiled-coil protein SlyX
MPIARLDLDSRPFSIGLHGADGAVRQFERGLTSIPRALTGAFSVFAILNFVKTVVESHESIQGISAETHASLENVRGKMALVTNEMKANVAEAIEFWSGLGQEIKNTFPEAAKLIALLEKRGTIKTGLFPIQGGLPDKEKSAEGKRLSDAIADERRKRGQIGESPLGMIERLEGEIALQEKQLTIIADFTGQQRKILEIEQNRTKLVGARLKFEEEEKKRIGIDIAAEVEERDREDKLATDRRERLAKSAEDILKSSGKLEAFRPRNFLESVGAGGGALSVSPQIDATRAVAAAIKEERRLSEERNGLLREIVQQLSSGGGMGA